MKPNILEFEQESIPAWVVFVDIVFSGWSKCRGFPPTLQENAWIFSYNMSQPFSAKSILINHTESHFCSTIFIDAF
jgi:hypothetical protein